MKSRNLRIDYRGVAGEDAMSIAKGVLAVGVAGAAAGWAMTAPVLGMASQFLVVVAIFAALDVAKASFRAMRGARGIFATSACTVLVTASAVIGLATSLHL